MNEKSRGIVLSQTDYKDNDAIISVLSEKYGKVSLYVKGYKKINSRNVYATQLFDCSEFLFDFNEKGKTSILKSASLIDEFAQIKADYDKLVICSFICEILNASHEDSDFSMAHRTLQLLEKADKPLLVLNLFLVNFIQKNGIAPDVDGCALCGSTSDIVSVSVEHGGFVCRNCNRSAHLDIMNVSFLKAFRIINKANYDVMDKTEGGSDPKITVLLMQQLQMYLGMNLKSAKSLEKIL